MMIAVDDDFCKCPVCGTEVWYKYSAPAPQDEITALMRDMARNHKPKEAMPAGEALPGGGSSSKSNKRARNKKKSLSALNQGLYINT